MLSSCLGKVPNTRDNDAIRKVGMLSWYGTMRGLRFMIIRDDYGVRECLGKHVILMVSQGENDSDERV